MAAPIGNKFWELRSKHGRDALFATPELLWEAACEYFEWCEANPLLEVDFRGKDSDKVELPHPRPMSMNGLCHYLGCSEGYFRSVKCTSKDVDLLAIITRIEGVTFDQQFNGAAAGFYNANIISRALGMVDKKEIEGSVTITQRTVKFGDDEIPI